MSGIGYKEICEHLAGEPTCGGRRADQDGDAPAGAAPELVVQAADPRIHWVDGGESAMGGRCG